MVCLGISAFRRVPPHPCKGRADFEASSTNLGVLSPFLCLSLSHVGSKKRRRNPWGWPTGWLILPEPMLHHLASEFAAPGIPIRVRRFWSLATISLPSFSPHSQGGWKRREHPTWLLPLTRPSFPEGDAECRIEACPRPCLMLRENPETSMLASFSWQPVPPNHPQEG